MSELLSLLLVSTTLIFLAHPLLFRRPERASVHGDEHVNDLLSKRDTTFAMIKELEFDRNSGMLSDEDYKELDSKYKEKAVTILKGIDHQASSTATMANQIEREVRRMRKGSPPLVNLDAEIERQVREMRRRGPASAAGGGSGKKGVEPPRKNPPADIDAEVERQIGELRQKPPDAGPGPGLEKPAQDLSEDSVLFCSRCGARSRDGDVFCIKCGAKLG